MIAPHASFHHPSNQQLSLAHHSLFGALAYEAVCRQSAFSATDQHTLSLPRRSIHSLLYPPHAPLRQLHAQRDEEMAMYSTTLNPSTNRSLSPHLLDSGALSRSLSRRQQFTAREIDPLLANLSPQSTLEALRATDAVSTGRIGRHNPIQESVEGASPSERAWGIKAALAGKKIKDWYGEVAAWPWPEHHEKNGFEPQIDTGSTEMEPGDNAEEGTKQFSSQRRVPELEYWGSVPVQLAQEYQGRTDAIRDDMDTLEVEVLKNYVRDVHLKAESRRSTLADTPAGNASYEHMDDFTAMITATIVHALPTLLHLDFLLNVWSTRLVILGLVPSFLNDLKNCKEAMQSAWMAIGEPGSPAAKRRPSFSRKPFSDVQAVLQDQILELARTLDTMLDLLEGSEDTLPANWIDGMDSLENEYGNWVVKAEELVLSNEMMTHSIEKGRTDSLEKQTNAGGDALELPRGVDLLAAAKPKEGRGLQIDGANDSSGSKRSPSTTINNAGNESPNRHVNGVSNLDLAQSQSHHQTDNVKVHQNDLVENERVSPVDTAPDSQTSPDAKSAPSSAERPNPIIPRDILEEQGLLSPLVSPRPEPTISERRQILTHPPAPLVLESSSSDLESDASLEGSATSDYFSNRFSPEILSANVATYMGSPVEVSTPTWSSRGSMAGSRRSSQYTERGDARHSQISMSSSVHSPLKRRSRAVTYSPDSATFTTTANNELLVPEIPDNHIRLRSASVQSFERVSRDEIRRLVVRRSGSYSPAVVTPIGVGTPRSIDTPRSIGTSAVDLEDVEEFPQGSLASPRLPAERNKSASLTSLPADMPIPTETRYVGETVQLPPPPPLSGLSREISRPTINDGPPSPTGSPSPNRSLPTKASPTKPRHRFEDPADLGPGLTPVKVRRQGAAAVEPVTPFKNPQSPSYQPSRNFDKLEARISSLLTSLPADIRFTSGAETPPPGTRNRNVSNPKTPAPRSSTPRLFRAKTSTPSPSMTLAPAPTSEPRSKAQDGEPEIKLYHLHQSGKDAPIKLYVRLVGEAGERVMVRVGGGWADLGEYLKEYALHHGKRTVSENPHFDIKGLPSSPLSSHPGSSRPVSPSSSAKPSPAFTSLKNSYPGPFPHPHTPHSESRPSNPALPTFPTGSTTVTTPAISAHDDSSSPSLAGPKKKKFDISPGKQAWVDDLLNQARHSGEKQEKPEKKGGVGLLGKVGATRRVFLRRRTEG